MKNRLGLIICVCVAILVFGAFITYGMRSWSALPFVSFNTGFGTVTANGIKVEDLTTHHTETLALENFSHLNLNIRFADVTVQSGTSFQLEYHYYGELYELTYSQENGTLTVQDSLAEKFKKNTTGKIFNGGSGVVYNNWVGGDVPGNTVTITVPAGTELETLEGKISSGDCAVSGVNIKRMVLEDSYGDFTMYGDKDYIMERMEIQLSSGDAQLSDLRAQTMIFKDSYGEMTLKTIQADSLKVDMSSGDLSMRDVTGKLDIKNSYGSVEGSGMNTTGLVLDVSSGEIALKGTFTGDTEIDNSYGEVEIETSLRRADYALDLHTSYDSIRLDGKRLRDEDGEDESRLRENDGAANRLTVDCSSGGIEIDFLQAA